MASQNFFDSASALIVDLVNIPQFDTKPSATSLAAKAVVFDRTEDLFYKVSGSVWQSVVLPTTTDESLLLACSNEESDLTTGTAKVTFRMPYAFTVTAVRASVNTAPVGSTIVVDINENGSSILSTKLSIDAGEKTSTTASVPAVISDASLADDAEITVDVDQVGSSTAGAGLKVTIIGRKPV